MNSGESVDFDPGDKLTVAHRDGSILIGQVSTHPGDQKHFNSHGTAYYLPDLLKNGFEVVKRTRATPAFPKDGYPFMFLEGGPPAVWAVWESVQECWHVTGTAETYKDAEELAKAFGRKYMPADQMQTEERAAYGGGA